jgi:hypothetical protein
VTEGYWRSRRGWIVAHLLCGIAAGVIGFAGLLAISLVVLSISSPRIVALAATLMTLAALVAIAPLIAYQSWALRRAVAPWAWCLAWTVAIVSAPLIVAATRPVAVTEGGNQFAFSNGIAGIVLAGLWGAWLQWLALRGKVGFARWLAGGGTALTLVTLAVGAGLVGGLIAWTIIVPVALALYGALTWPPVRSLVSASPSPPSP